MTGIPLQTFELSNWLGLNTQAPITDCDPHYVVNCQNVEFDDEGVIAKRRGMQRVSITLSGRINLIHDFQCQAGFVHSGDRQKTLIVSGAVLNVVHRFNSGAEQEISATFSSTAAIHYVAVSDNGAAYISNELGGAAPKLLCYNSGWKYVSAALAAPASAPSIAAGSAGSLTGVFNAIYNYQDIFGNESNPSPKPTSGVTLSGNNLNVQVVGSSDTTVNQINVFVKTPSTSVYKFAASFSNTSTTVAITATETAIAGGDEARYDYYPCPFGKYVVIHNDMLIVGGDPSIPDLIYVSNWRYHRQFSTGTDFDRVVTGDGQPVKGFGRMLSSLVVAKGKSLHSAEGEDNTTFKTKIYDPEYGVLGQPSMTFFRRKLAYFSDDGIYADNGMVPDEISLVLRPTIRQLNPANLATVPAKQLAANYKYYKKLMFAVREATGAGDNDAILVFNYERGTWTKYKGFTITAMGVVHNPDEYEFLYGGDASGNVFLFSPPNGGSPNSDNITGTTSAISAFAETPWLHLPRLKGNPNWMTVKTEAPWFILYAGGEPASGNSTITITTNYYTNFSSVIRGTFSTTHSASTWPTMTCDPKQVKFGGAIAQFDWIKFRFTNNVADEHFRIYKLAVGFRPKPAREY